MIVIVGSHYRSRSFLKKAELFMYSMKEACQLTNMTYENLKFYCKKGLVPNVKRDQHNYRVFDEHVYRNDKTQYIEKFFSETIEGNYSVVLKDIITKANNATPWYISNCFCMTEEQKVLMSICLTMQFLRTRKSREMVKEGYTKMYEVLFRKLFNQRCGNENEKLKPGEVPFSIGKEALKLQHAEVFLNIDAILELSNAFLNHIWIIYINDTEQPFWTSDSPIAINNSIPKPLMAGKGISSEGVEIYLPLNGKTCLALYDRLAYADLLSKMSNFDDRFYLKASKDIVDRCNMIQLKECFRCVYSEDENFDKAEQLCKAHPELMEAEEYFDVG